jgi:hypothetical protein
MDRLDFSKIASVQGGDNKIRAIHSELERVGMENISISDCIVNRDRDGGMILNLLQEYASQGTLSYKLKVLLDVNGNPVKPGDLIEWKHSIRKRDIFGKKLTIAAIKNHIRRGEIRMIEIWHNAVVDAKGCITVGFEDASILLSQYGVHFETKQALTSMPEKTKTVGYDSYEKDTRKPTGLTYFWRYMEVQADKYLKLTEIAKKVKE